MNNLETCLKWLRKNPKCKLELSGTEDDEVRVRLFISYRNETNILISNGSGDDDEDAITSVIEQALDLSREQAVDEYHKKKRKPKQRIMNAQDQYEQSLVEFLRGKEWIKEDDLLTGIGWEPTDNAKDRLRNLDILKLRICRDANGCYRLIESQ